MSPKTCISARGIVKCEAPAETTNSPHTANVRGQGRHDKAISLGKTDTPISAQKEGQGLELAVERQALEVVVPTTRVVTLEDLVVGLQGLS